MAARQSKGNETVDTTAGGTVIAAANVNRNGIMLSGLAKHRSFRKVQKSRLADLLFLTTKEAPKDMAISRNLK